MGQIVRRKRKGRHSSDKNSTDRGDSPPSAAVDRRSSGRRRRNVRYNFDINDYVDDDEFYNDEEVDIGRRRQKKKIKLLLYNDEDDDDADVSGRRVSHAPPTVSASDEENDSDSDSDEYGRSHVVVKKRRKVVEDDEFRIEEIREGNLDEEDDEEEEEEEEGGSDYDRGSIRRESDLPDKYTLEVILDKLQKKDIYGVYAAPVDPDELPDYYDVIKHPMDFATVRRKLEKGLYLTLKEFESDVLLICSNAMQYNAPDTIYYKQASSIQEQAKLRFHRLRSNVDRSEIEPKSEQKTLPSFSLPKKQFKKSVALNAEVPVSSEIFSGSIGRTELPNGLSAKNRAGSGSFSGSIGRTGEALNGSSAKNRVGSETFSGSMGRTGEAPNGSSAKKRVGSETCSGSIGRTGEVPKSLSAKDRVGSETLSGSIGRTGEVSKGSSAKSRVGSETLSGSVVRAGELPTGSSAQTLVRTNSGEVPGAENSSLADNDQDKDQEPESGNGLTAKLGRKPSVHDENRRATYNISLPETDSDSVLLTFEGESKQFIPVGLHAEHSYARSLARFAATLGSVAWKVASQSIEQALPEDVKFGRGWVGEYEPLSTPVLTPANRTLKEANFHSHSKIASDIRDDRRTPKGLVDVRPDSHKVPVFVNHMIPVKQESPRIANKDHSPRPFFSSMQASPAFSSSNLLHQNSPSRNYIVPETGGSPQVELNHPPPMHVSAADFVAKRAASDASDVPSPRQLKPVSRNKNLAPMPSFKHPNNNNKGNPNPVGLDCNRTVPADNNVTRQQEPQGLSDPVQMMKMLAQKGHHQQNNSNGFGFNLKREESNNGASTIPHFHSNTSQIGSERDDSSNVALTAAQSWMSLGATGFLKSPSAENVSPHKQPVSSPDSLYNPNRHQPQVSRFRGELNTYQQPVYGFVTQPVRMVNDGQPQNRNVGFPQMVTADLSRFQVPSSWRGLNPHMQVQSKPKQQESRPPDLNIGYQSMGSPVRQSTGMLVDSQQPDLALQL